MKKERLYLHFKEIGCVIFVFMFSLFFCDVQAINYNHKNKIITFKIIDTQMGKVLDSLSEMADVKFFYNHSQLNLYKKISIDVKEQSLEEILNKLLKGENLRVEYQPNNVVVFKNDVQPKDLVHKISGKVFDAKDKQPLPGATIILKEQPGLGVITDSEGKFVIEVCCYRYGIT